MTLGLESFRLSSVLGIPLLILALAMGNSPVRADDAETAAPVAVEFTAATMTTDEVVAAKPATSATEEQYAENCDEGVAPIAAVETNATNQAQEGGSIRETDVPPALTAPAIPIEVTASASVVVQPQVAIVEEEATEPEAPVAVTGAAILVEITQSVVVASPGQAVEEDRPAGSAASEAAHDDAPVAQTGAAILMEITQSVTIAAPGEVVSETEEAVDVASLPDQED